MNKYIIPALLLLPLLLSTVATAWGPATHAEITRDLLNDSEGNWILELCNKDQETREAFMIGSEIPDITVVYYFESGGAKYRATHNWNFQQDVMLQANNDREKAFAYGIAQHLISDSIAHQDVVPASIESNGIPNWLLHPLLEQKYDSYRKQSDPTIAEASRHMFDALLYGQYGDRYIAMCQNALGDTIDVREHAIKLAAAFDSFYNPEGGNFKPENVGIFGLYPMIAGIADWLSPYTSISGVDQMDAAYFKTLQQNKNIFNNWGARHALTPHGFDDLVAAEEAVGASLFSTLLMIYIIAIFAVPIAAYLYFKKIIVVPIVLLIMIIGIIAWFAMIYFSL